MLITVFGRWVNPSNILAVVSEPTDTEEKLTKIIFNNSSENGFRMEFKDKSPIEVATEINNQIAAGRKSSFGDRGERRGGGRDGFGDKNRGFKKRFDRERDDKPAQGSDEHIEQVRDNFKKRKEGGERKYESRNRKDFRPKKRKDW